MKINDKINLKYAFKNILLNIKLYAVLCVILQNMKGCHNYAFQK